MSTKPDSFWRIVGFCEQPNALLELAVKQFATAIQNCRTVGAILLGRRKQMKKMAERNAKA